MAQISPEETPNNEISRRGFIKYLLGFAGLATLGGVFAPIIGYLWPPERRTSKVGGQVRVASLVELQAAGGVVVPAENQPIVLTYSERGSVQAFSAICPHLGCVVQWHSAGGYIECPCHDGRFNGQTGAVISGPPPASLPSHEVTIDGDDVYISL